MDQPLTNLGQSIKKTRKIFYSHTKTEISEKFLYFYHEIEISKNFYILLKHKSQDCQ